MRRYEVDEFLTRLSGLSFLFLQCVQQWRSIFHVSVLSRYSGSHRGASVSAVGRATSCRQHKQQHSHATAAAANAAATGAPAGEHHEAAAGASAPPPDPKPDRQGVDSQHRIKRFAVHSYFEPVAGCDAGGVKFHCARAAPHPQLSSGFTSGRGPVK